MNWMISDLRQGLIRSTEKEKEVKKEKEVRDILKQDTIVRTKSKCCPKSQFM